jgi:hypothetical protein
VTLQEALEAWVEHRDTAAPRRTILDLLLRLDP